MLCDGDRAHIYNELGTHKKNESPPLMRTGGSKKECEWTSTVHESSQKMLTFTKRMSYIQSGIWTNSFFYETLIVFSAWASSHKLIPDSDLASNDSYSILDAMHSESVFIPSSLFHVEMRIVWIACYMHPIGLYVRFLEAVELHAPIEQCTWIESTAMQ